MFDTATAARIATVAKENGIEPAALIAVAEVESGGVATVTIDGREEPLIRFEGHYFDRRLSGDARRLAREKGLASPVAGAVRNPPTQAGRWALLAAAAAIDRQAAYESVSWGIGQVMGAHWKTLGYANVGALVAEVRGSVEGQIRLMIRFIAHAGLSGTLNGHDWSAFARRYNGPLYRRYRYDEKLAAAWAAHRGRVPHGATKGTNVHRTAGTIGASARVETVRDLQRALTALGYPLAADGAFGPATQAALIRFQRDQGLVADGIAGLATMRAISRRLPAAGPTEARVASLLRWLARLLGLARHFIGFPRKR